MGTLSIFGRNLNIFESLSLVIIRSTSDKINYVNIVKIFYCRVGAE